LWWSVRAKITEAAKLVAPEVKAGDTILLSIEDGCGEEREA